MRLPDKPKSRQKVLVLAGLVVAGAAYGVWMGVYEPLRGKRAEALRQSEALEAEMKTARTQIQRIPETRRELERITRELWNDSERHMLHPRLGNYLLEAREILALHARAAGVAGVDVAEIGLVDPPQLPKKNKKYLVRAYAARVSASCGYAEFAAWVRGLEESNPLLALSHFTVAVQPADPLKHLVRFEVQWPVWIDPGMRETVREKTEEILGDEAP